jgi:hypothetical protein
VRSATDCSAKAVSPSRRSPGTNSCWRRRRGHRGRSAFQITSLECAISTESGWNMVGADDPKVSRKRALQSPGNLSKVYVPVITKIFKERYRKGASSIIFSLDDVRNACDALGVASRNPADVI